MKYLEELKKLKLNIKDYAIFGSGPLAIRGLRENDDIDIIVKENLWTELIKKYKSEKKKGVREYFVIKIGNIEIYQDWLPWFEDVNKLIDSSEIIKGFPFVSLKYFLEWKKEFGREKDLEDIKIIEKYKFDY